MATTQAMNRKCRRTLLALLAAGTLVCAAGCAGWTDPDLRSPWPAGTVPPASSQLPGPSPPSAPADQPAVRGQSGWETYASPGSNEHYRRPMPVSSADGGNQQPSRTVYQPANDGQPPAEPAFGVPPTAPVPGVPAGGTVTGVPTPPAPAGNPQWLTSPFLNGAQQPAYVPLADEVPGTAVPVEVLVEEARTGRFMFGAGINSDAGVTGQIIIDERNFDLFGFPRSWAELWNGEAFRGRGQGFRIEAVPGNRVQRYLVSFTEPYLFSTPVSLSVSGFLYDRGFYDWTESRVGGQLGFGYRLTPDLSASAALRLEDVKIRNPRVVGVEELDRVLGSNDIYSGQFTLRHDTRDLPFMPTEGHLIELSFEQVFGSYDYPKGDVEYRRYFLVRERPDGSGRHTLAVSLGAGVSGSQTPIFENYFAGGFSTLRGFEFRGASPVEKTVTVGGRFRTLGSVEYTLPLTADDMIKAVAFCDFGTVERDVKIDWDNFRVAPGFGFRISVPALGPAPLAFDFAFPVTKADTDDTEVFSFFFGFGRG